MRSGVLSPKLIQRRGFAALLSVVLFLSALTGTQAAGASRHILGLHLVHTTISAQQATSSQLPDGYMIVPARNGNDGNYLVAIRPFLSNADFVDISAGFDEATNAPAIYFRLSPEATKLFAEITRNNIGNAFAIVVDGTVISAPIVVTEIAGGSGIITGSFGIEDVKDLVARMTAAKTD